MISEIDAGDGETRDALVSQDGSAPGTYVKDHGILPSDQVGRHLQSSKAVSTGSTQTPGEHLSLPTSAPDPNGMTSASDHLPRGFRWGAATAGIKASGRPDVALAVADTACSAAVMFTSNQVVAAPVIVGREHMHNTGGTVRALLINAGNANCATGEPGIQAARQSCERLAHLLDCSADQIIPSSTGIIGVPLPAAKLLDALPSAIRSLGREATDADAFAHAILTTDTRVKIAYATVPAHGEETVRIFGCCKGAGMIGPRLAPPHATMLVYLFTDLRIAPADLRGLLAPAVETSFNSISVDGDTSTNDTVLLLGSGSSGIDWQHASKDFQREFTAALGGVCDSLAHSIVADGEGVTHVVTLQIDGAPTDLAARSIARSIAHSPLCKTAWSSADPNWGRILAAAGYAGVPFDPALVIISIGGIEVFSGGVRSPGYDEAAVHARMLQREYVIAVHLHAGDGRCRFLTCDLTEEYVRINADYST